MMQHSLVILDRDGVINFDSDEYIKSADEWQPIPGSLEAIAKLKSHGVMVAVASNQAGVARGKFALSDLHAMHEKMTRLLAELGVSLDHVCYCTDGPDSSSKRRKPEPGMLLEIFEITSMAPSTAIFIGDSYKDYQAAQNAGCDFALVESGKGSTTLKKHPDLCQSAPIYANLAAFVDHFLATS